MTKVEESVREKRIKKWKDEGNLSDRAVPVKDLLESDNGK